MNKRPLTCWLVWLIIVIGPLTFFQGIGLFTGVENKYGPQLPRYPSLPRAMVAFKLITGAAVCVSIYTAWVLYRRKPGTLRIAKAGLVMRTALMIAGAMCIPLLGGFPTDVALSSYQKIFTSNIIPILATGAWYLYLVRSQEVKEIFTP